MTVLPNPPTVTTVKLFAPDGVHVFPHADLVSYGLDRRNIFFRTAEGRQINAAGMPWLVETVIVEGEPKP